jgi:hypothetical protein
VAGGDATLEDKEFLWFTKAKRGELIMPSAEEHLSLMVLAATAVSVGEQAVEEKTVRERDVGGKAGRVKRSRDTLGKQEPTDSDRSKIYFTIVCNSRDTIGRNSEDQQQYFGVFKCRDSKVGDEHVVT